MFGTSPLLVLFAKLCLAHSLPDAFFAGVSVPILVKLMICFLFKLGFFVDSRASAVLLADSGSKIN